MKILRLIEHIALGTAVVGYLTESVYEAVSPQAQRITINRLVNLKEKRKIAKEPCGTQNGEPIL